MPTGTLLSSAAIVDVMVYVIGALLMLAVGTLLFWSWRKTVRLRPSDGTVVKVRQHLTVIRGGNTDRPPIKVARRSSPRRSRSS